MKLSKIVSKIKKYIEDDGLAQKKQEKLQEMIEKLSLKKIELKHNMKTCETEMQKEEIHKQLEAIATLLKKSEKLLDTK